MSEKTWEVPQLAGATYALTLVIESTHEYKVHGPYRTIWSIDHVIMSTFNDQSMSIGCVGKLGHFSGFLRHYLLISFFLFIYCQVLHRLLEKLGYINILRISVCCIMDLTEDLVHCFLKWNPKLYILCPNTESIKH